MRRYHWLEELHTAHYATLLQLARSRLRRLTGSTSEAEDVVQDVFLLAAEKNVSQLEYPLRWLMKATSIMCLKRRDRGIRESKKEQRFIQRKMENSADRSVYAVEREESETEALLLMMTMEQTLSKEDWELMKQYCLQGVPIEEISEKMGVPVNTLRVRICRIRKNIEKRYPDM